MTTEQFEIKQEYIDKINEALDRGLSSGIGTRDGQMCVEAAVCYALGLPHGDNPGCVSRAVRAFKIRLNDSDWSSPEARAEGMRKLAIAQLGSKGIVDDVEFARQLSEKIIQVLIPKLFRGVFPNNQKCLEAAQRCEAEGTKKAAWAADVAAFAACAVQGSEMSESRDEYLVLCADLALEVLRELRSPGCEWLLENGEKGERLK